METLPLYLAYVSTCIALMAFFAALYIRITPYREMALIRAGNRAAAVSLGGTLIGLALVLASVATHSVGLLDLLLWGVVALAFQLLVYFVTNLLLPDFRQGIEAGRDSYGIFLAALSVAVGLINAGAVSY